MADDVEVQEFENEFDNEPLFADDIEDEDDIPLPPSPINTSDLRQRAREELVASRQQGGNRSFFDDVDDSELGPLHAPNSTTLNETSQQETEPIKKRKPMLNLGPDRLTGERGFKTLREDFPKIKFKGKGHEASDLSLLLRKYKHWAHRLFPKMTFKDVLDRVEKLEKDKEVKVCLSFMRQGREFQATVDNSDSDEERTGQPESANTGQQQQSTGSPTRQPTASSGQQETASTSRQPSSKLHGHRIFVRETSEEADLQNSGIDSWEVQNPESAPIVKNGNEDSDSDEEWNMLGRKASSQRETEDSSPNLKIASGNVTGDSDDEWSILKRNGPTEMSLEPLEPMESLEPLNQIEAKGFGSQSSSTPMTYGIDDPDHSDACATSPTTANSEVGRGILSSCPATVEDRDSPVECCHDSTTVDTEGAGSTHGNKGDSLAVVCELNAAGTSEDMSATGCGHSSEMVADSEIENVVAEADFHADSPNSPQSATIDPIGTQSSIIPGSELPPAVNRQVSCASHMTSPSVVDSHDDDQQLEDMELTQAEMDTFLMDD